MRFGVKHGFSGNYSWLCFNMNGPSLWFPLNQHKHARPPTPSRKNKWFRAGRCFQAVQRAKPLGAQSSSPSGYGSKLNQQGTAGFSHCFHLPGFHFRYLFLTHSHLGQLDDSATQRSIGLKHSRLPDMSERLTSDPTKCLPATRMIF